MKDTLVLSNATDDLKLDSLSTLSYWAGDGDGDGDCDGDGDGDGGIRGRQFVIGLVERVFEDGFLLNTGDRTLQVDAWDLFGDNTRDAISIGQELTVVGEFDGGEFDAFSITSGSAPIVGINSSGDGDGDGDGDGNGDGDSFFGDNGNNVIRGSRRSDDIRGRGGRDRLIGRVGDDDLFGEDGNDILVGNAGDDDLFGGGDRDVLRGGRGQDDLQGGAGRDILIGGGDRDTFILEANGNDIIRDFVDGVDEIGLADRLEFSDLDIQQRGNNTVIFANGSRIAKLLGVDANSITPADLD